MRLISGKYGGRTLRTTVGEGYRPATARLREALFSMLEARGVVWDNLCVLDLFAGSGSLGFEALSRGAFSALFVETNPKAAELIQKNAQLLEIEPTAARVITDPVAKVLGRRPVHPFGLVFIDPPYAENTVPAALKLLLKNGWLCPGAIVAGEVESKPQLGKPIEPESFSNDLKVLTDRAYGQTRLILWELDSEQ